MKKQIHCQKYSNQIIVCVIRTVVISKKIYKYGVLFKLYQILQNDLYSADLHQQWHFLVFVFYYAGKFSCNIIDWFDLCIIVT